MPEKVGFWKRLHRSKKMQIVFFCVSMVALIGAYLLCMINIKKLREDSFINTLTAEFDYNVLFDLEEVSIAENGIFLKGWAFRQNSKNVKIRIVLQATDGSQNVILRPEEQPREDIKKYFDPTWEFGNVGFQTYVTKGILRENINYEVLLVLYYESEIVTDSGEELIEFRKMFSTGQYVYKHVAYKYNPEQFVEPSISDDELVEVIKHGDLKNYDIVNQIWIYQYDNELYFIMNPTCDSIENSNIRIPVMPYTSRADMLPEHRIIDGYDHLGAFYEDDKYKREGILPYQVFNVSLPTEYPITYISTGLYDVDSKSWISHFMISMADWREHNIDK